AAEDDQRQVRPRTLFAEDLAEGLQRAGLERLLGEDGHGGAGLDLLEENVVVQAGETHQALLGQELTGQGGVPPGRREDEDPFLGIGVTHGCPPGCHPACLPACLPTRAWPLRYSRAAPK